MLNFVTFDCIDSLKKWTILVSVLYHDMELPLPPSPSSGLLSCLLTLALSVYEKGYVNGKRRIVGFNPKSSLSSGPVLRHLTESSITTTEINL